MLEEDTAVDDLPVNGRDRAAVSQINSGTVPKGDVGGIAERSGRTERI